MNDRDKNNPGFFVEHNELGQQTNLPSENKKTLLVVVGGMK